MDQKVDFFTNVVDAWWTALSVVMKDAFESPGNYVIQKTAGIFSLNKVLRDKVQGLKLVGNRVYDSSDDYLNSIDGGRFNCMNSKYWVSKPSNEEEEDIAEAYRYGSRGGYNELYGLINDELMNG